MIEMTQEEYEKLPMANKTSQFKVGEKYRSNANGYVLIYRPSTYYTLEKVEFIND